MVSLSERTTFSWEWLRRLYGRYPDGGGSVEQEENPFNEETMEDSGFQNNSTILGNMINKETKPESIDSLQTGKDDKVEARTNRNVS